MLPFHLHYFSTYPILLYLNTGPERSSASPPPAGASRAWPPTATATPPAPSECSFPTPGRRAWRCRAPLAIHVSLVAAPAVLGQRLAAARCCSLRWWHCLPRTVLLRSNPARPPPSCPRSLCSPQALRPAVASTVGVTSKPEVTVLPLPSPAAPPAPTGISNAPAGAASYCSSGGSGPAGPAGPAARERQVLIVASDGLWEWVSNAQAVGIASSAATGVLCTRGALCMCCDCCVVGAALARSTAAVPGTALLAACVQLHMRRTWQLNYRQLAAAQHSQLTALPSAIPPPAYPSAAAEDAAHALVEAAHKQWAVRYRGRNCDDVSRGAGVCVTCGRCFWPWQQMQSDCDNVS